LQLATYVQSDAHRLTLLSDMSETVAAFSADISRASRRAWIETYICRDDAAGDALVACLTAARQRGADARLLYDPLGCRGIAPEFFAAAAARGIAVRAYQPHRFAPRGRHRGVRNHARSALLDDVAFTGGANVGHEWLPRDQGGEGWHDVCVRFEGPVVEDVARSFQLRWDEADRSSKPRSYATGARHARLEWISDAPGGRAEVLHRYRERIRGAGRRIWIENAYFLPPPAMLDDLMAASRRGVDVRLILPRHTDLPIVRRAARIEYGRWLDGGLQLFEYLPATLHSKYAVIDDDWSTIGTFNALSVGIAYGIESNLIVRDPAFVAHVAAAFARDLERSESLTHESLTQQGTWTRLRDRTENLLLRLFDESL
jgi:cardiolipin synthase